MRGSKDLRVDSWMRSSFFYDLSSEGNEALCCGWVDLCRAKRGFGRESTGRPETPLASCRPASFRELLELTEKGEYLDFGRELCETHFDEGATVLSMERSRDQGRSAPYRLHASKSNSKSSQFRTYDITVLFFVKRIKNRSYFSKLLTTRPLSRGARERNGRTAFSVEKYPALQPR